MRIAHPSILLALLSACRNDLPVSEVEKPSPPDMQPLIAAYAQPTAALDAQSVAQLSAIVAQRISTSDGLLLDQRLADAARAALMQLAQSATAATAPQQAQPQALRAGELQASRQALTIEGQGYLVVTRICDGWGALPVADFANGYSQLTVGFDEQTIDPVIWGTLRGCKYRVGSHTVQIDGREPDPTLGDLRAYIGPGITLANFAAFPNPVLIQVNAQATIDEAALPGEFSARITLATRALELLVPLASGHVLVAVDAARGARVSVRALNGTFSCDLQALRCSDPSGREISAP